MVKLSDLAESKRCIELQISETPRRMGLAAFTAYSLPKQMKARLSQGSEFVSDCPTFGGMSRGEDKAALCHHHRCWRWIACNYY